MGLRHSKACVEMTFWRLAERDWAFVPATTAHYQIKYNRRFCDDTLMIMNSLPLFRGRWETFRNMLKPIFSIECVQCSRTAVELLGFCIKRALALQLA